MQQSVLGATFICVTLLAIPVNKSFAQTDMQRAQNLVTCLNGQYPSLCKRQWLSNEEQKKADIAERRENLSVCLTGRYPSLCNRSKLMPEELQKVVAAEKRENLKVCLSGRYKSLCKKDLLTQSEHDKVVVAERTENLKVCLTGRYAALCDYSLLSAEQLNQTRLAERTAEQTQSKRATGAPPRTRGSRYSGCDSGHWVQSVSNDGQIVILEDGSVWQVDPVDAIDSMLWLPVDSIVACDDKLINTDDNESVSARRIR
jgi:hypothetical protein